MEKGQRTTKKGRFSLPPRPKDNKKDVI